MDMETAKGDQTSHVEISPKVNPQEFESTFEGLSPEETRKLEKKT